MLAAERGAERLLEVGAVDAEVRRAEPLLVPVVLLHRVRRDPARRPPVPVDQLGGDGGVGGQLVRQTQPRELADRVGGQGDGGTDLGQLGRLLEHVRLDAALLQGEAEGQPPDAGADDRHAHFGNQPCP